VEGPTKLKLRVSPGAARAGVVGRQGAAWKIRVTAPPEDGKANDAVVRLLAETLGLPRRDVEIVSGYGAREKVVALAGIGPDEIEVRLASAAAGRGKEQE
jgi:uncharacterized protein (TIGR00251 family)